MGLRAGYKQTELGVIPDSWVTSSIGDKTTKVGSGITPTGGDKVYKREGRPFLRSQNVGWGVLLLDDIAYIDEATHATFSSTEIEVDDVFLNITGASIGRSAVADSRVERGNVNQHVCIIRPNKKQLHPVFLNYFLLSREGQRQIDSFQTGGNRQGLNFAQIRSFGLALPSLSEQRDIATALSDIDALLAKIDQLIEKKRDLKQAAMQQLLTGQTRLPGFSEEWEVKPMKSLGHTYGGLAGKTKEDFGQGTSKYIPFMNVMADTVIDCNWLETVDITQNEAQNLAKKGDLFFNGSSETPEEVGFCSVLMEEIPNLYLNSFCFGFRFNTDLKVCGLFFAYWFRGADGRSAMSVLAQGATRYNISKSAFMRLFVPQPSHEEQTAIATVLSDIDAELTALKARRDKTCALKQGMMQALLTGRIRLIGTN